MKLLKSLRLIALSLIITVFFFVASEPYPAFGDGLVRGVYPATPISAFTLYAFDPDLLGAWNTPLYDYEKKFIPENLHSLPVLGGWYGQGFTPDREMVVASGLKMAFLLENDYFNSDRIRSILKELGLDLVTAPDGAINLPACFRAMGESFNRQERGEELAQYAERALNSLKPVMAAPEEKKIGLYFAMGADGLNTSCPGEGRAKFIELAGGRNVMSCPGAVSHSRPRISFEELMAMNPEAILVESYPLKKIIDKEERWGKLRAVKAGRVYLVPRGPFSWNGHPALTTLMGSRWLANILYPDLYKFDVVAEAKEFNRLFFRLNSTDDQIAELLDPSLAER